MSKGNKSVKFPYQGQTLIGILIALAIFTILGQTILTLTTSTFKTISFTKSKIAARQIAQERIELIRNMPYDSIGTVGGIPSGNLLPNENISRNGLNYTVKTSVVYIDDPFDQTAPDDLLPTDYKRVRVDVSWEGIAASNKAPVVLVSDVTPKGVETTAGGGTISILVFDANGLPVPQANVSILADTLNPVVNLDLETNINGRIILPGAPACTNCYQVTVTKSSYSTEKTYSTSEVANPAKPHLSVVEGSQTEAGFAIDLLGTLNITSVSDRESGFAPIGNATFRLAGEKIIGTDIDDQPVYKFDSLFTTDTSGNITIQNVEWDGYKILLPAGSPWDVAGTNPLAPVSLAPSASADITFILVPNTINSLLAIFTDPDSNPLASVSATLSNTPSYEETKITGSATDPDFGQVFFSGLSETVHQIVATASGFLDLTDTADIFEYTQQTHILDPI